MLKRVLLITLVLSLLLPSSVFAQGTVTEDAVLSTLQTVESKSIQELKPEPGDKAVEPNPYINEEGILVPPDGALRSYYEGNADGMQSSEAAASITIMSIKQSHPGYIMYPGEWLEYQFVPRVSGVYRFQSTTSYDTYGMLCSMNWYGDIYIDEDDDDGDGYNFAIDCYLQANTSYKLYVRLFNSSLSGCFVNASVSALSLERRDVPVKIWVDSSYDSLMSGNGLTYGSYILGNVRASFDETFAINMVGVTPSYAYADKQHYQYQCVQSGNYCASTCWSHHSNADRLLSFANSLGGASLYSLLYAGATCRDTSINPNHGGVGGLAYTYGKASIVQGTGYDWGTIRRMEHEITHNYGGTHSGENGSYCNSSCINNGGWDGQNIYISNIWCDNCYRVIYNVRNMH